MDLAALRIFINIVKLGSFADVARHMDIDPSTVSRSISSLEAELGFRLFQRTTRKLAPTEAGSIYFERVHGLIDDFEIAGQQALDLTTQPQGHLRVSACTSFGPRVLAPLLPKFLEPFPDLTIELLLADHQVDIVREEIDLTIRFGLEPKGDLVSTRLSPRQFSICASPSYIQKHGRPTRPEDLGEHDCITFRIPGHPSVWRFRDSSRSVEVPVAGKLVTLHGATLTASAVSGLGIAMLPDWLCVPEITDGRLINLFPSHECTATDFDTAAWIVYPSRSYVPLKVRRFIEFLTEEVGDHSSS